MVDWNDWVEQFRASDQDISGQAEAHKTKAQPNPVATIPVLWKDCHERFAKNDRRSLKYTSEPRSNRVRLDHQCAAASNIAPSAENGAASK
jgi:hypothetical protein